MAKVNVVATQLSGKVSQLIYRQTKYGTVVYEAPVRASVPQRTKAQMLIPTQWGNVAAVSLNPRNMGSAHVVQVVIPSSNHNEKQNGGNTGGSGTGSVTPVTVTARSFAGEIQFEESTLVAISGPTGAVIHYTVDDSTPTAESAIYSKPLTFTEITTLKAIAVKDGVSSQVTSRTYTKGSGPNVGGEAADIMCPAEIIKSTEKLAQVIVENGRFDQLILYPGFVHVSWKRNGQNRQKILRKVGNGYRLVTRKEVLGL